MTSTRIILLPGYVVSTDRTVKVIFCKGILDRGIKRVKTPQNDRNEPAGRPFRLVRITVVDQFPIRALYGQVALGFETDAQDLKFCEGFPREGSSPSPGTLLTRVSAKLSLPDSPPKYPNCA